MHFDDNVSPTGSFRSVLLGSTAIALGMVFVFGAGLYSPVAAETLRWNDADTRNDWDQDDSTSEEGLDNWLRGAGARSAEDFNPGDDAVFEGTPAETITVIEDVSPDSMTFDTSGYVINGTNDNTNIIFEEHSGGPDENRIDVVSGTAEIGAVIRFFNDVTVNEAGGGSTGTLILSGANQDAGAGRSSATITLEGGGLTISGSGQIGFEDSLAVTDGDLTVQGQVNVGSAVDGFTRGNVTVSGAGSLSLEGGTIFGQTLIQGGNAVGLGGNFDDGVLMTGGALDIEATTSGDVVNGEVGGTGGTLTINQFAADGSTPVALNGNVTNNVGATVNNGTINGNIIQNGGTVANNASPLVGDPDARITGTVTVNDGGFTNAGEIGGTVTVSGSGADFDNTGSLESTLNVTDGSFDNQAGGSVTGLATVSGDSDTGAAGVLTASGGSFDGGIQVDADGELIITADTGTALDPVSVTNNGGTININAGNLTTDLLDHQDGITNNASNIVGDVDVAGGTFNNQSGADIDGSVDITGTGVVNADGGTFQQDIQINGGTLNINTDFDETAPGAVQTILNSGNINVGAGAAAPVTFTTDFDSAGGTTTISANGILDNVDAVDDTIILDAGELVNSGIVRDEVRVVAGGTLGIAGGTFDEGVDAQGGNINITADSDVGAGLENNGSTITLNAGITLTGPVTNTTGLFNSTGDIDGTLNITGGTFTQTDATAETDGVTGRVTVSGADGAPGTLLARGGDFETGIDVQAFGILSIGDDTIDDPDATGDVINNGGTVTIATNGQLTGSLTNNSGTSTIETGGTLTGPLTITGTEADSIVNVEGVVRQDSPGDQITLTDGTLNLNDGADVQVGIIQNGADVDGVDVAGANGGVINATGGFFSQGLRGREGVINIDGAVGGTIIIESSPSYAGSELNIGTDGILTGRVIIRDGVTTDATNDGRLIGLLTSEGGVFENNGVIQGPGNPEGDAIVVAGGTVNNNTGGDVTTTARVQSGTLIANGGNFTGGVIVEETAPDTSTFDVVADMSGDITNNSMMPVTGDGAVTINAGTVVTGSVTNNSGRAVVDGQISGMTGDDGTLVVAGGEVVTSSDTTVDNGTTVSGGTLTANGGTFTGGILATSGQTDVNGVITIGGGQALISDDGAVNIAGSGIVTGDVQANNSDGSADGVVENLGQITGSVTVGAAAETGDGAVFDNSGAIDGGVTVNNGTFNMDAGVITTASSVNEGGTVVITDNAAIAGVAIFDDGFTNEGGEIRIEGNAQGDIRNDAGDATIDAPFTLTGDVTNGDGGTLNLDGNVTGTMDNDGGVVNAAGTVGGAATNQNTGDTGADGGIFVADTSTATFTSGLRNFANGLVEVAGTLNGAITNETTGDVRVLGGALGGTLTNDLGGDATFNGVSTATVINNSGAMSVGDAIDAADSLAVSGALTNLSGGVLDIASDGSLGTAGAGSITNASGGDINLNGRFTSAFTNAGDVFFNGDGTAADDGRFGGLVTNADGGAILLQSGNLSFANGLVNNGVVSTSPNATPTTADATDTISISGGLSGSGTFVLDVDLSDTDSDPLTETPLSDTVVVTGGAVTGNVILDFNIIDTGADFADPLLVFDADATQANNYQLEMQGLPGLSEAVLYIPTQNGEDYFISNLLNPGIGALAGTVVLTQSLIGSVINRPSSPFVSGLAYDDPDPCGAGAWARAIGGQADSNGDITTLRGDNLSFESEISADYSGFQAGGDLACFNGYFDGWDISVGGIAGVNQGTTEQPVRALTGDGSGGLIATDVVTSITDVDFDQAYAGVYITGAYNRFSVDLQYRLEQTNFTATNTGVGGLGGLGLTDSEFGSDAATFSGSASYAIPFGESNVSFIPTAGFAYTNLTTDPIVFDEGDIVQINDFSTETVFVGGTLSRSVFGEDGTSAINQFGTVTYYTDMADEPISEYVPISGVGARTVSTENLGAYTEISAGLNYLRILPLDAPLGAKQLSASVRGDLRGSERLDSWGITGQFRIQF